MAMVRVVMAPAAKEAAAMVLAAAVTGLVTDCEVVLMVAVVGMPCRLLAPGIESSNAPAPRVRRVS
jgi:hypothetical protein